MKTPQGRWAGCPRFLGGRPKVNPRQHVRWGLAAWARPRGGGQAARGSGGFVKHRPPPSGHKPRQAKPSKPSKATNQSDKAKQQSKAERQSKATKQSKPTTAKQQSATNKASQTKPSNASQTKSNAKRRSAAKPSKQAKQSPSGQDLDQSPGQLVEMGFMGLITWTTEWDSFSLFFSPRGDLASVFFTKEGLASVLFRELSFQVVFRVNSFFCLESLCVCFTKSGSCFRAISRTFASSRCSGELCVVFLKTGRERDSSP